jgi:hypothetical protein
VAVNFWFEHIIDAYLEACAEGGDWSQPAPPPRPILAIGRASFSLRKICEAAA